jgi:Protease inhibitor Inh
MSIFWGLLSCAGGLLTSMQNDFQRRTTGWAKARRGFVLVASLWACAASSASAEIPPALIHKSDAEQKTTFVKLKTKPSSASVTPSDVAGRYAILREGGKDTGCMLTLDAQAKAKGGDKASLSPACRDQGIVIFDPTGWRIVDGRLVLTARKGHTTHLDAQPDGTWKKDATEGKGLSLKKL